MDSSAKHALLAYFLLLGLGVCAAYEDLAERAANDFITHSVLASRLLNLLVQRENPSSNFKSQWRQLPAFVDVNESEDVLDLGDAKEADTESEQDLERDRREKRERARRIRALMFRQRKRGLGHCIHNCINNQENMNFIQCKTMCH